MDGNRRCPGSQWHCSILDAGVYRTTSTNRASTPILPLSNELFGVESKDPSSEAVKLAEEWVTLLLVSQGYPVAGAI